MGCIRLQAPEENRGRVTAGIPSLDPLRRHSRNRQELKREYQRALRNDAETRREAAVAPDGLLDITNYDQRRGTELSCAQIMVRLQKMCSGIWFKQSETMPDVMLIYVRDETLESGKRFICGFENGISPEFEVVEYEEREVPNHTDALTKTIGGELVDVSNGFRKVKEAVGTKRGWRTVLLKLLRAGVITQGQIERYFPMSTGVSRNWQTAIS